MPRKFCLFRLPRGLTHSRPPGKPPTRRVGIGTASSCVPRTNQGQLAFALITNQLMLLLYSKLLHFPGQRFRKPVFQCTRIVAEFAPGSFIRSQISSTVTTVLSGGFAQRLGEKLSRDRLRDGPKFARKKVIRKLAHRAWIDLWL